MHCSVSGFYGIECLQILQAWAAAGLVHGDLKPSNIGITDDDDDTVYLLDVETVVTLDPGKDFTPTPKGFRSTEKYRAPEVNEKDAVCSKSDLYSVGIALREVAKVRHPSK